MIQVRVPRVKASQHPIQLKGQPKVFAEPFFCDTTQPSFSELLERSANNMSKKGCVRAKNQSTKQKKKMQDDGTNQKKFLLLFGKDD